MCETYETGRSACLERKEWMDGWIEDNTNRPSLANKQLQRVDVPSLVNEKSSTGIVPARVP